MPVPEVIIPSESYSLHVDDTMSFVISDFSSKDTEATFSAPMSL